MKKSPCLTAFLLAALSTIAPTVMIAQNPPAKTHQPGFWQPAVRLAIDKPITIQIINKTDVSIDYNLTTNQVASPVNIEPGKSSTIKDFLLPVYLLINPSVGMAEKGTFVLRYETSVNEKSNQLIVNVTKIAGDAAGNNTLNISETGAVYLY